MTLARRLAGTESGLSLTLRPFNVSTMSLPLMPSPFAAYHIPVLKDAVVSLAYGAKNLSVLVDATVGDGGHLEALLGLVPESCRVLALDQDASAIERAKARLSEHPRFESILWVKARFSAIPGLLNELGMPQAGFVLLDLGVSSRQLEDPGRGFSFRHPGPLDMRMDPFIHTPAKELVNTLSEKELADTLWGLGQEPRSRRIARAIMEARRVQPIESTSALAQIIERSVGRKGRSFKIHPATRSFMALRIAVNDELGELQRGLEGVVSKLGPCGRIVVISYHSLEDGLVKRFFKARDDGSIITKKPVRPGLEEVRANHRSRSAKLRCFEKEGQGSCI